AGEEDGVSPLEPRTGGLVLEPATLVRGGHPRLLAHALRSDDDVFEVEVDVRKGGQELGVEASRALVSFPAGARSPDLVDAVVGQRRDESRQVTVVLGDRVRLPELADVCVFVLLHRPAEELEDALARHGSFRRSLAGSLPARA